MIRLYISNEQLNEDIQIARIDNDRYNQKRLIFVSDVDDKDEIFFVIKIKFGIFPHLKNPRKKYFVGQWMPEMPLIPF
jgi:hypothetical protein